jgi:hypothetical protein
MKPVTRGLIETHLGKQKRIKQFWWGGYSVDLESGASVTITRKGIDFGKYREFENRGDIEEWLFQEEVKASIALAAEIWGGIGLYGKSKSEDRAAILAYAASAGIDTGDQGLVWRHFGAEATIKYTMHGMRVSLPNGGYVKFDCGAIEKVCGDLLRPALAMIHEIAPDKVVVRGKPQLLLMAINEAKAMDISVIPESDLEMFITLASNIAAVACGVAAFLWLNLWEAMIAGCVIGCSICAVLARIFWKRLRNMARRKGLEIVGLGAPKSARKTQIEDARRRGML